MNKEFMQYERPSVTADVVLLTIGNQYIDNRQNEKKSLRVLLIKREEEPCSGLFSLPGGFVGIDEQLEDVARRKVLEKAGYADFYMEQLYTFDAVHRDERWRVISTAYIGVLKPHSGMMQYGSHYCEWFDIVDDNTLVAIDSGRKLSFDDLAFDHGTIIRKALERIRGKLFYSDIGFCFENDEFTIGSLNATFEAILQRPIHNFKRTMQHRVQGTGKSLSGLAHRPAEIYRKK